MDIRIADYEDYKNFMESISKPPTEEEIKAIADPDDEDDDSSEQCSDDLQDSLDYEQDTYEHYSGDYS